MEKLYGVVKKLDKLNLDKNEKEKVFSFFKNVKRKCLTKDEFDDAMLYIKRLNIPTNNKIELMEILKDYGKNNLRVKKDRINELYRELAFQNAKSARRDVREFYEDLSENVFYLVYSLIYGSEYFFNEEVFSEIALENIKINTFKKEENYQHLSIEKILELAKEGIEAISEEYLNLFNEVFVYSDDKLFFTPKSNPVFISPSGEAYENESLFTPSGGYINIRLENNISDVFVLIHEFIHYTNGYDKEIDYNSRYFTEFFSHYSEIFTARVLKEKHPEYKDDIDAYLKDRFSNVNINCIMVKLLGMFIRNIEDGKYIGRKELYDATETIISLSNDYYNDDVIDACLDLLDKHFCYYVSHCDKYAKAFVLSGVMDEHCKKDGISYFTTLNHYLYDSYICEMYDHLGIKKSDKAPNFDYDMQLMISSAVTLEIFKDFLNLLVLEDDEDKMDYYKDFIIDEDIDYHLLLNDNSSRLIDIDFDKVEKSYKKLIKDIWRQ